MENRYCDLFILIFVCIALLFVGAVTGATDGSDVSVFSALQLEWGNTVPPSWSGSDPCGSQWDGVACTGSRVTSLTLPSMGLKGTLPNLIVGLSQLQTLDLSYNPGLTGNLPTSLGNLTFLTLLSLIGCGFSGQIPSELGNLTNLNYLALNSNKFSGSIPPSLGNLAKLSWLDLAANQLTGILPVSNDAQSGLNKLFNANHFHFNLNNLSGPIPPALFSDKMNLIHVLFDSNRFENGIPSSVGLVTSLKVLRLDRNLLTGTVPSKLSNLASLQEINLSNNRLNGAIPDLSALSNLQYMDMSNNSFTSSQLPQWLTSLQKLTTVVMENCSVNGEVTSNIFSLPALESVRFKTNKLNGTLVIQNSSNSLYLVDLRSNGITADNSSGTSATISLADNPFCSVGANGNLQICKDITLAGSYETNMANCDGNKCSGEMYSNPKTCQCQQPYEGSLTFRAPSFSDLSDTQRFQGLENDLTSKLGVDAVRLFNLQLNEQEYLIMSVQFFPFDSKFFNRSEINRLSMQMSNQLYKPPEQFGPYFFIGTAYVIGVINSSGLSSGAIAGIAVGVTLLAIGILVVGFYAFRQKKRAEKAIELHKPFAFWGGGEDNGEAPKLKGARWFSFEEIKKATNNFSELNQIGKGGYGTVYKATLPTGEMAAIKRAQQGSIQGVAEFKNEIELLSRVHHKNLVGLIGFCTEQGEQMLVYEYIPSGTLRENLIGQIPLSWERRLQIALGSARGLAYLHELANPPIIHRDIKSSNILLDENMNGKVADFGLSKLVADGGIDAGGKGHVSTQVKGTLGYLDPEYYMTQQLSEKSDVYSFGIVLLELITARLPIEGGKYIVRLVNTALDNGGIPCLQQELMDPVLRESTSLIGFEQFLDLAMRCVEELGSERPTMSEAVKELESIVGMGGEEFNSSTKPSKSSPVNVKWSPNLYQGDEDDDSISLSEKGKDDHNNMFEYSGAYMVSRTVQPK